MLNPPERPAQSKFCSQCGHRNHRTAKVCVQCGHGFKPDKKWCPACGTVNNRRAKVCTHCGHRFRRLRQNVTRPPKIAEAPISQNPDAPISLPEAFTGEIPSALSDGEAVPSLPVNLEG